MRYRWKWRGFIWGLGCEADLAGLLLGIRAGPCAADCAWYIRVMPRLTTRTPEIVEDVLHRLGEGQPLAQICRTDGYPHPNVWRDWCDADETLAFAYARAREIGFDAIALEALAIADETSNDTIATEHGDKPNSEWISRSRLRVDTRLKLLAKWDPKRYGDRTLIGSDPDNPLPANLPVTFGRVET